MISNRLRYLLLFFACVVLCLAVLLWRLCSYGYFDSYAITYDRYGYPLIVTELQGQSCSLVVDIGCRFPLSLPKETLDGIDKEPQGIVKWHNIKGLQHEAPSYLIPKMKVGNLTLKNIVAHLIVEEDHGKLGKFLGEEFNLLLDFSNNRIIACDTFSKLQAKKLVGKDWVSVPFEIHNGRVFFCVDTDFGTRNFGLNTTSTITYLRSSFLPPNNPFPFVSSPLIMGGQNFGNVIFESIDLPEDLYEIDGFIGMDFLKEHSVYLDYAHKIAYIEPPRKYFERIPVIFSNHNVPTIDVSVEGNFYPLKLDLGSLFPFAFREEILQNMRKSKYGTAVWHDFRGKKYESPTYTIPEITINNLKFAHAFTKQDRDDFHVNVTLGGLPSQPLGIIGLPILEKYNLFLDFPHSAIYASSDHLLLQQGGLLSQNLLTIPFIRHRDGILLSIETDTGIYRLLLDTGSTRTVIRAPYPTSTTRFCIMGHDFGERSVAAIDLSPQFDFDGYLGMDFLREYPLFIDYSNKMIFIDLQKDSS